MGFEWDAVKNLANLEKHGIDFDFAIRIFDGLVLEGTDVRRDYGEIRALATGEVDGRVITLVYALRGGDRRIISARSAHKSERRTYHQALAAIASRGWED